MNAPEFSRPSNLVPLTTRNPPAGMLSPPLNVFVALFVCKKLPPETVMPVEVACSPESFSPWKSVEVPVLKLATLPMENRDPGVVVAIPTFPDVGLSIVFPPAPGLMVNAPDPVVIVPPVKVSPLEVARPTAETPPENVVVPVENIESVPVAVMLPAIKSPWIAKYLTGVVEPTPMLPPVAVKVVVAEPVPKLTVPPLIWRFDESEALPCIWSFCFGPMVPMPTLPALSTASASVPAATMRNGLREDPVAVVIRTRFPVPVLSVVSVKLNKSVEPVVPLDPQLNSVLLAFIVSVRLASGVASELQSTVPEQLEKIGVPPLTETRQSVPAPPVAVCCKLPNPFTYTTPFVFVSEVAVKFVPTISPTTESAVYGEVVPMPNRLFVLSQIKFESPPKEPELLNCTCVFEPPGVPLPPPPPIQVPLIEKHPPARLIPPLA